MGPRLFSRGMDVDLQNPESDYDASMGPRLFSRGMGSTGGLRVDVRARFNGAAAVQPRNDGASAPGGKSVEQASMGPRLFSRGMGGVRAGPFSAPKRFNGAAAVQPRNAGSWTQSRQTSRPLQWGRGCSAAECDGQSEVLRDQYRLQWGRGCSAAECWVSPSSLMSVRLLQWGRGCSAAEWPTYRMQTWPDGRASMGPRLFSRGMCLRCPAPTRPTVASMGPRLFSRGMTLGPIGGALFGAGFNGAAAVQPRNDEQFLYDLLGASQASMGPRLFSRGMGLPGGAARTPQCQLQWGRGCSAAECSWCRSSRVSISPASMGPRLFSRGMLVSAARTPIWPASLQWGRGCSAAECGCASGCRRKRPGCFNGAAAVQPRNAGESITVSLVEQTLQWGRGCSAAECLHQHQLCVGRLLASMGPRLFSRGMDGRFVLRIQAEYGFNGAAAVQPRNGCLGFLKINLLGLLQWGRGCSAAECARKAAFVLLLETLQWGRGCSAAEWTAKRGPFPTSGNASMGPRLFSRGMSALLHQTPTIVGMLQWGRGCSAAEWSTTRR